jgi:hypothetical protein
MNLGAGEQFFDRRLNFRGASATVPNEVRTVEVVLVVMARTSADPNSAENEMGVLVTDESGVPGASPRIWETKRPQYI